MILNNGKTIKGNVDNDHLVLIGEGYFQAFYFVLYDGIVYCCTEQEGELFIKHRVCDEKNSGIVFPCYQ